MKYIDRMDRLIGIVVICVILIAAIVISVRLWRKQGNEVGPVAVSETPAAVEAPAASAPVLDYGQLGKETPFKTLMDKRKEDLGVNKGVDIIAKPNESLKIGEYTVSMQEILDQIRLKEGGIVEKKLDEQDTAQTLQKNPEEKLWKPGQPAIKKTGKKISPEEFHGIQKEGGIIEKKLDEQDTAQALLKDPEKKLPEPGQPAIKKAGKKVFVEEVYGIHVVRPGDNIWNIHFAFLKDYFAHKGIALSPLADESDTRGVSSGIGKILKFSEKMVYIYNVKQRKIDLDLNMLQPLTKIVIFKMKPVFALMDRIDYKNVDRIQFDGEALWLPAQSG